MNIIDESPELSGKVNAADIFVEFGKGIRLKDLTKYNKSDGPWYNGWNELFDGTMDFGSPERWRLIFTDYLESLKGWP
jgi:hypothetical protein